MSPLVPPLAHHMLVLAIPFFGPVLVIGLGLAVMVIRDRWRGGAGGGRGQ